MTVMRMCPNCKRLSRDDDFCSRCGAAVYPENSDYSEDISCTGYAGHSHEKTTYTRPYSTLSGNGRTEQPKQSGSRNAQSGKSKNSGCVIAVIIFIVIVSFLSEIGFSGFSWLN